VKKGFVGVNIITNKYAGRCLLFNIIKIVLFTDDLSYNYYLRQPAHAHDPK
jgi:hypothetical protein